MSPVDKILSRLNGVRRCGKGWVARCPAHDDHKASLSLSESSDGRVLLFCHAGCSLEEILGALQMSTKELFPQHPNGSPRHAKHSGAGNGRIESGGQLFELPDDAIRAIRQQLRLDRNPDYIWEYSGPDGRPAGFTIRWDLPSGKLVRPIARRGSQWIIGAMEPPRPLYGLAKLAVAEKAVVVEGEKCVNAAESLGFVATTSAGGASAAHLTDWSPLAGKVVWILPDNDKAGRKYAEQVADILAKLSPPARVKIVELPGLPEGGDLADWIAERDAAEPEDLRREVEALAESVDPWESELEADPPPTYRPFPVEALPEPLQSFVVSAAEAVGCDPAFVALPALVVTAAAIGNARRLRLKRGWDVPAVLWGMLVGESGTQKTPVLENVVLSPVNRRQERAFAEYEAALRDYEEAREKWEVAKSAWKKEGANGPMPEKPKAPVCRRFIVSDVTVEALALRLLENPRGLLLARDELSGWVGSFDRYAKNGKGGDEPSFLSMYNAGRVVVDRKTAVPPVLYVPRAAVSIIGGVQPQVLRRVLSKEHRESGLAARFLFVCPPRVPKVWKESDIPETVEQAFEAMLERLWELDMEVTDSGLPVYKVVHLLPEAHKLWVEYFNVHAQELNGQEGDLAAAWAKLEETTARLALVIHFARWAAGDVFDQWRADRETLDRAIRLVTWFKNETERVYKLFSATPEEEQEQKLLDWLARHGGAATPREVAKGCRWLRSSRNAEAALDALAKSGLGEWEQATPGKGRPSRKFRLRLLSPAQGRVGENNLSAKIGESKPMENKDLGKAGPIFADADTNNDPASSPSPVGSDVQIEGDVMIF